MLLKKEESSRVNGVRSAGVRAVCSVKESGRRYAWVAQQVNCQTSAQVMISRFAGSSPTSRSVLTSALCAALCAAWSLLRLLCLPLSAPPPLVLRPSLSLSLSLKKKLTKQTNKHKKERESGWDRLIEKGRYWQACGSCAVEQKGCLGEEH